MAKKNGVTDSVPLAAPPPPLPEHPLSRLKYLGFVEAGVCNLSQGKLCINIADDDHAVSRNVLYAFVVDGEVVYIGKSTRKFRQRMHDYCAPSASQKTSTRNNRSILKALALGKSVVAYVSVTMDYCSMAAST